MLATGVLFFRFAQYFGATILLGSSLFFIYGLPRSGPFAAVAYRWPKNLLLFSAVLVIVSSILGLISQTGLLAGSFSEGLKLSNLQAVVTQMNFGWSNIARAVIAAAMLPCLIVFKPSSSLWVGCAIAGAIVCVSLALMGHGAATEGAAGYIHLSADITHSLAAAIWIGALVCFLLLLLPHQGGPQRDQVLYASLRGFSGIGSATVAVLVVSGLINSWFLIGLDRVTDFWTTPYELVLLAKLAVFVGMLLLAGSNRYLFTPALGRALTSELPHADALTTLRRSLVLETLAAFVVLGLVGWLGTLAPVKPV